MRKLVMFFLIALALLPWSGIDVNALAPSTIKGHVVTSAGAALANAKMEICGQKYVDGKVVEQWTEFTTDANGDFSLDGGKYANTRLLFRVKEGNFQFAVDSPYWAGFDYVGGEFKLSNMEVKPAGRFKVKLLSQVDGKLVSARLRVDLPAEHTNFQLYMAASGSGTTSLPLPAGAFRVMAHDEDWFSMTRPEIKIEDGKDTDIGEIKVTPRESLDVRVIGPDKVLNYTTVKATLVSGEVPYDVPGIQDTKRMPIHAGRMIGGLVFRFQKKLFRGKWKILVENSQEKEKSELQVEIPATTTPEVKFGSVSGLEISVTTAAGDAMPCDLYLLTKGSEAAKAGEKLVAGSPTTPLAAFPPGMRLEKTQLDGKIWLLDIEPNTYTILAARKEIVIARKDNVTVKKGTLATAALKGVEYGLFASVTQNGAPCPDEEVYFAQLSVRGIGEVLGPFVTGADGTTRIDDAPLGLGCLMSARELAWVKKFPGRDAFSALRSMRHVMVGAGEARTVGIELPSAKRCWLKVKVPTEGAPKFDKAYAIPAAYPDGLALLTRYSALEEVDGHYVFDFGPVPPGAYWLDMWAARVNRYFDLQVPAQAEFEATVKVGLRKVSVEVAPHKIEGSPEVRVFLHTVHGACFGSLSKDKPTADGVAVFEDVPDGDVLAVAYAVVAGEAVAYASVKVPPTGDFVAKLKFKEKAGRVSLDLKGGVNALSEHFDTIYVLEVFDERGKPVEVPYIGNTVRTIGIFVNGLEAGSYKFRLSGSGFATQEFKAKVEADKKTVVPVTLSGTAGVLLTFPGVPESLLWNCLESVTVEPAKGKPLAFDWPPQARILFRAPAHIDTQKNDITRSFIAIQNVPLGARYVRVKLTGFGELYLALNPKAGATERIEATLKPK